MELPYELVRLVAKEGKLPVPNFSAGGIATPADASLVMQLGAESVFVGSGIFMGQRSPARNVRRNIRTTKRARLRLRRKRRSAPGQLCKQPRTITIRKCYLKSARTWSEP